MTTTLKRVIGLLLGTGSYAVLTVLLAGCGGGERRRGPAAAGRDDRGRQRRRSPAPPESSPTAPTSWPTARPRGATSGSTTAPAADPGERFAKINLNGVPTVFGVVARRVEKSCKPSWYRVRLPRRPNGRLGWVRAADVKVGEVRTRILVDLSERRVTLYRSGKRVLTTRAAVGATSTPTPTGTFYVDQRLYSSDPGGPFGPSAVGIAAYSEVLTGWTQGGPIAIHGTNRPDLIGQAVSNGCVRVRNEVVTRIFDATLSGTPVVIQE